MRVRASSLNYRDLMVLKGGGRGPTKLGVVPLSDGAGEVAAIGDGVTRVKIGDRIAGCFHPRWFGGPIKPDYLTDRLGANLDGMLAEYALLSEEALIHLPSHLSFEEAATLPCAAVTAWVALTGHRRVTAGDSVLAQGSGGNVRLITRSKRVALISIVQRMTDEVGACSFYVPTASEMAAKTLQSAPPTPEVAASRRPALKRRLTALPLIGDYGKPALRCKRLLGLVVNFFRLPRHDDIPHRPLASSGGQRFSRRSQLLWITGRTQVELAQVQRITAAAQ
jgi:hypothetical protein